MKTLLLYLSLLLSALISAQPSQYGLGLLNNVSLDSLNQDTTYLSHVGESFVINDFLNNYTYNLFIPNSYDGTEAYGLITSIHAGNNGNIYNSWIPVLEEKKLILVAGNGIGNSIAVNTRIGVALAGALALEEQLNIDPNRIYTTGTSGGGRSASALMFFFPEIFKGMIPNCGATYLRRVDQDYETHQPNSHYEYIYPHTPAQLQYVKGFDPKLAYLTSFDDFREGDIMNIYHNGAEPDGFKAKFLEIPGPHCTTSEAHFRDGMNFLEHPHLPLVYHQFQNLSLNIGDGFIQDKVLINNSFVLNSLNDTSSTLKARNPLIWNDSKGAILRLDFDFRNTVPAANNYLNLGIYDLSNSAIIQSDLSNNASDSTDLFLIRIVQDAAQPRAEVYLNNPSLGYQGDLLFSGRFTDWDTSTSQSLKVHFWKEEWRIEFASHFDNQSLSLNPDVKLLDDLRSVRIRNEAGLFWDSTDFQSASMLALKAGAIDINQASSEVEVHKIDLVVADTSYQGILNLKQYPTLSAGYQIFPNPANNLVYLKSPNAEKRVFQIIDSRGKEVGTHFHQGRQSEIDLGAFEAGLYIIRSVDGSIALRLLSLD